MTEKINDFGRPIGASRPGSRDLGQLRGEGLTGAGSVLTLPALETELHRYRGALRRQILQMALVPSVSARRSLSAVWTDARPAGHPRNQPLTADPLRGQNSYALPEGPTRSSLHTVKLLLGPRPIKSATESEAEPIKSATESEAEPQKVSYELVQDRRSGKMSADQLKTLWTAPPGSSRLILEARSFAAILCNFARFFSSVPKPPSASLGGEPKYPKDVARYLAV